MELEHSVKSSYFDAYTLYIGQNTLQIFANFEDDPPITSSRISSTSSKAVSEEEEESDTDSGVGRISPVQHDQDDEFTVLWYGTPYENPYVKQPAVIERPRKVIK